jgi:replicative DNA helicase
MTEQQLDTFSKFGKSFQEKLVKTILFDRNFANQMEEVLDTSYLELKYLQVFVDLMFQHKASYPHPTYEAMVSVVRTQTEDYSDSIIKQVIEFMARIKSNAIGDDDDEYVKEKSLDFCKKQKLKEAILKSVDLLQSQSFDQIQKVINDAMNLGADNDCGHDWHKDVLDRFEMKMRNPISTHWEEIDTITKGGLGKRELGVVVAPTGAGKSMALAHLGAMAVVKGKTVVHYTLELADTVVGQRYDSCITGIELKNLMSMKDAILMAVEHIPGKLIIKEYPTKSASTRTILSHLEKLKQKGINVDMIIVDYADLLRPTASGFKTQELRHSLGNTYEELRAIGQVWDIPVWTASQTNRSGLNAEVITMEAISEAFNKCFVADFICTISRTVEDKTENKGRMFVAKNRNGIDGIVYPMEFDTSRVHLKVLPPDEHSTIDAVVMKTKQEQDEHLRKKYKRFKQERTEKAQAAQQKSEDKKKQATENKSLKNELRKLATKLKEERETS